METQNEDKSKRKTLDSSWSNEALEYSTRIQSRIPTAAKLSTVETRPFLAPMTPVKTKLSKPPIKSNGTLNKLMSRVPAIVGFGVELDEESKRGIANDQDIRRGNCDGCEIWQYGLWSFQTGFA